MFVEKFIFVFLDLFVLNIGKLFGFLLNKFLFFEFVLIEFLIIIYVVLEGVFDCWGLNKVFFIMGLIFCLRVFGVFLNDLLEFKYVL